jgi:serine/threonine-protein kinase
MVAVASDPTGGPPRTVGRYALFDEIGRGGTATVHLGRLVGPVGFSKTVAIKRMHENLARDPDIAAMFLDEARLASRIQHSNVVATLDVLAIDGEAFLVMEYVSGESLAPLLRTLRARGERVPPPVAVQIVRDVLHGLHAAHEAKNELGESLDIVHRDVSPHNIFVGVDGIGRVFDFGIAKAVGRLQDTRTGQLKGKVSYMAPEQLLGGTLDRRADIFAAALVLWEALVGKKPFEGESDGRVMYRVLEEDAPPLRAILPDLPASVADAVAKAASRDPAQRFATALEFARALEYGSQPLPPSMIGDWVREIAGPTLTHRQERLRAIEAWSVASRNSSPPPPADSTKSTPPVLLPAGPEDETQSELSGIYDSGPQEFLRPTRSRVPAIAVGAALVAAVSAGAFLVVGRAKPAMQVAAAAAVTAPPEATALVAAVAPQAGSPQPQTTAPAAAPAVTRLTPAAVEPPQPKRVVTKHPPAHRTLRRPEDLFSRE